MTTPEEALRRVQQAAASYAAGDVTDLDPLLAAIRALGAQYAFEHDGRSDAIAAVRHALPVMERDLFDAIVEDHACEVAALREALAQVAKAVRLNRADR
jgi:hypothetical protein